MNKLPDKPSELIRVALADLKKCEADNNYHVEMSLWHEPTKLKFPVEGGSTLFCQVCLAGAVMGQTLGIDFNTGATPSSLMFDDDTGNKLRALNEFRQGHVGAGLQSMGVAWNREILPNIYISVPHYEADKALFHESLKVIAKTLEGIGL